MQRLVADPLALVSEEDDSAETKEKLEMLTRLDEEDQLENYLSYGKWDLKDNDIERLQKDDEMRQRVSIESLIYTFHNFFNKKKQYKMAYLLLYIYVHHLRKHYESFIILTFIHLRKSKSHEVIYLKYFLLH